MQCRKLQINTTWEDLVKDMLLPQSPVPYLVLRCNEISFQQPVTGNNSATGTVATPAEIAVLAKGCKPASDVTDWWWLATVSASL